MAALPPLPADDGSCRIELFGPPQPVLSGDTWGTAKWGGATWAGGPLVGWQDVTPQSMNLQVQWGVDDVAGVLSVPAAGSWLVTTYDPNRLLDPSNYNSPFQVVLRPGGLVRVMYNNLVVRVGFIDEIEFDMASKTGSIRASDGISLMSKARCPAGLANSSVVPLTLRARARYLLDVAKVRYIAVEAVPSGEVDPLVGKALDDEVSPWQQIITAALDALNAVWLDRNGVLRFRNFGSPNVSGVAVGGATGIAIDNLTVRASMESIYTHVRTQDDASPPNVVEAENPETEEFFGNLQMTRQRSIPNAWEWARRVLDDRSGVNPQYIIGTMRPQTSQQLQQILDLGMVDQVSLYVDSHGTPIARDVRVLGGRIEANTETGWSAGLGTYEPGWNWNPAPPLHAITAKSSADMFVYKQIPGYPDYTDSQFQLLHVVSSMLDPTDTPPPIQAVAYVNFPAINWSGVTKLVRAKLVINRPWDESVWKRMSWFYLKRVTAAWAEGNQYPFPGPATTDDGKWANEAPGGVGWYEFDVFNIVKAWAPVAIGGQAAAQYGIQISPFANNYQSDPTEEAWFASRRYTNPQGVVDPSMAPYLLLYVER